MATFTFFDQFFKDFVLGTHDISNLKIKAALTNTEPNANTDTTLADIAQITTGNGYTTDGFTLTNAGFVLDTYSVKLLADELTITALGGAMATWRYVVYYNNMPTPQANLLIGFADNGSAVDLADGESRTLHT